VCYQHRVFTGLVQAVGEIVARTTRGAGARLRIAAPFADLVLGESISVAGVCLTVDARGEHDFEADASAETLAKTTLGSLPPSSPVNLERALKLEDRLGGHIVTGHVDGVGQLVLRERDSGGDAERLVFRAPRELMRFIAAKGSIAVDGISLTVNHVEADVFSVAIIPRTKKETTIGALVPDASVNLEIDVLARYVLRAVETPGDSLLEVLRKNGYV
jgi:riboflavin synthase